MTLQEEKRKAAGKRKCLTAAEEEVIIMSRTGQAFRILRYTGETQESVSLNGGLML